MKSRFSSSILIGYMILAFGWWAVLLWRSNEEKLALQTDAIAYKLREILYIFPMDRRK